MNRKENNNTSKISFTKRNMIIIGFILAATLLIILLNKKEPKEKGAQATNTIVGGDLTIAKADITKQAKFYGYESDGTYMEVLAVRASDGTVRTALNTCQVCYNSGRGYYIQQGDILVCQNCGNQFTIDQVEQVKDGCNPVPIEQSIKTEDNERVVIKGEELAQYESLFGVWEKQ